MTLNVAFLWHMHQPIYIDPFTQDFVMPWVRLHGVRAYSDMISFFEKGGVADDCKVTFNLVPSLLKQVSLYEKNRDVFFDLSMREPQDLTLQEKAFILRHFFSCHWPTMVEPYERYRQLLEARGRDIEEVDLDQVVAKFNDDDLRDLQVWFNLTWIGFSLREKPLIKGLFAKGRLFSESEKKELLSFHLNIVKGLVSRYKTLWEQGKIDISTSPFYHPILPLIIDTESAKRCMGEVVLPSRFAYPEDAEEQLVKAQDFMKGVFGMQPKGLWPSEGAVSPELIPLAQRAGFEWLATDEAILHNTLGEHAGMGLFRPYSVKGEKAPMSIVFRHQELSDLIGFVYQKAEPTVALRDFRQRLKEILTGYDANSRRPPLCVVALDGENPWEYYMDGGQGLLEGLYTLIASDPDIHLTTITDYLQEYPPETRLDELYTGSWINGDFSIWIGGREENTAWEELLSARLALSNTDSSLIGEESFKKARENILIAEGSDWFWWYGDKFYSDFAPLFDKLFRGHLMSAYHAMGQPPPNSLEQPIKTQAEATRVSEPMGFIDPEIDGRTSFYWEWAGAGQLLPTTINSMFKSTAYIKGVAYGFNVNWLFIKVEPAGSPEVWSRSGLCITVEITCQREVVIKVKCPGAKCEAQGSNYEILVDGERKSCEDIGIRLAYSEIVEMAIPFALLGGAVGEKVEFFVRIDKNDVTIERWPETGAISLVVPDRDFERRVWLI